VAGLLRGAGSRHVEPVGRNSRSPFLLELSLLGQSGLLLLGECLAERGRHHVLRKARLDGGASVDDDLAEEVRQRLARLLRTPESCSSWEKKGGGTNQPTGGVGGVGGLGPSSPLAAAVTCQRRTVLFLTLASPATRCPRLSGRRLAGSHFSTQPVHHRSRRPQTEWPKPPISCRSPECTPFA